MHIGDKMPSGLTHGTAIICSTPQLVLYKFFSSALTTIAVPAGRTDAKKPVVIGGMYDANRAALQPNYSSL